MGLQSPMTVALLVVLTLAAPVGCIVAWNRVGRARVTRTATRVTLVVLSQFLAVALVGVVVNRQYDFYGSWSELFGQAALRTSVAESGGLSRYDHRYSRQLTESWRAGHGTVVRWTVPHSAGGVPTESGLVYLPAAYGDPAFAHARFPVVELLDGFPGTPRSWTGPLHVQHVLDQLIAAGESLPFIAVMPWQNIIFPHDTECVNVVGGPQTDTYLTTAVRRAVLADFRADPSRYGWSLMGYSTGGYCAMNLALRHPDLYGAAVSLSGAGAPAHDHTTGNLFGTSAVLREHNTPLWEAQHWAGLDRSGRPVQLLAVAGRQEPHEYRTARRLAGLGSPLLRISALLLQSGAHNMKQWRAVEPFAFNWLSLRMHAPLDQIAFSGGRLITGGTRTGRGARGSVTGGNGAPPATGRTGGATAVAAAPHRTRRRA